MAVYLIEPVADMEPLAALVWAAVHEAGDLRGAESVGIGIEDDDYQQAEQKVHCRARDEDDDALPRRLIHERARIVGRFVLPGHGAEAAEGDAAQGIDRLALLLLQDDRTHAERELLDFDAAGLRRSEVPKLMYADEHAEKKYCQCDVKNSHLPKFSMTYALAAASASRTVSRSEASTAPSFATAPAAAS